MKRMHLFIAVALLSTLTAVPVLATDEVAEPIQAGTSPTSTVAARPQPTALELRIASIREQGMTRVQDLAAKLQVAGVTPAETVEIQRDIQLMKIETEASVLRAIADDARETGDMNRATEADLALDHLLHPEKYAPAPVTAERPVPQGN